MELEMALPIQRDIDLISFYMPTNVEDEMWRNSLLMMRCLIEHLKYNVNDTKKHVILQLTHLSISDPISGASAGVEAWNGEYTINYSIKLGDGDYKEVKVGTSDNIEDAVKLIYIAFGNSIRDNRDNFT